MAIDVLNLGWEPVTARRSDVDNPVSGDQTKPARCIDDPHSFSSLPAVLWSSARLSAFLARRTYVT